MFMCVERKACFTAWSKTTVTGKAITERISISQTCFNISTQLILMFKLALMKAWYRWEAGQVPSSLLCHLFFPGRKRDAALLQIVFDLSLKFKSGLPSDLLVRNCPMRSCFGSPLSLYGKNILFIWLGWHQYHSCCI